MNKRRHKNFVYYSLHPPDRNTDAVIDAINSLGIKCVITPRCAILGFIVRVPKRNEMTFVNELERLIKRYETSKFYYEIGRGM